ncbi:Alpha/Beta hydrolase protein [Penicillium verhagenii]|uniref:Alpha/Beta hydrolase protein n=1 Tax=Penicillium verhagenii TaxID=1562060 RepID=UPI0025456DF5|nr:Alpha/Beta hydrolase protein [Penicillium verhagenii]KAJ5936655.1 Alpha/Beta hydrolase protein [Penicillium verhagenii]
MSQQHPPHTLSNIGPMHAPQIDPSTPKLCIANKVNIKVCDPQDSFAPSIIHEPPIIYEVQSYNKSDKRTSAVVLVSGAGGGVSGPAGNIHQPSNPTLPPTSFETNLHRPTNSQPHAGIYPSLADKIALLLSIPCIRLDYRTPSETTTCTADIRAALDHLHAQYGAQKFLVVGWSFGGSPCFSVAAQEPERVLGVVAIASQIAGTEAVRALSPRPLLLLHGEADSVLSPSCSETLFHQYGEKGDRRIRLFPGDDHGLTGNAALVERKIFTFAARCLGLEDIVDADVLEQAGTDLVHGKEERLKEMVRGRDLVNGERLF